MKNDFRTMMLIVLCGVLSWSLAASAALSNDLPVTGLAFSPDGKSLAAAIYSNQPRGPVMVWNVEDWSVRFIHRPPKGSVDVAFSTDSKLLAHGMRNGNIGILRVSTGEMVRKIDAHTSEVSGVAFVPGDNHLISCSKDRTIKLWDVDEGKLVREFEGHSDAVSCVAVSPDGQKMLSSSHDKEARLWDLSTGQVIEIFSSGMFIVRRVRFSSDGKFFVMSAYDGTSRIRETATGTLRAKLSGSNCADLSIDNRLAATCDHSSIAKVFAIDLEQPTDEQRQRFDHLIEEFKDDHYGIREAAMTEIGKMSMRMEPLVRAAMTSADAEVRVRTRRLRNQLLAPEPIVKLKGHSGDLRIVRFSPDGRLLATACLGGDVKVWDSQTYSELVTLQATPPEDENE